MSLMADGLLLLPSTALLLLTTYTALKHDYYFTALFAFLAILPGFVAIAFALLVLGH